MPDENLFDFVFKQKAQEIAKHLGFDVTIDGRRAQLKKNHKEICIKKDYRNDKRMLIYGVYPATKEGDRLDYFGKHLQVSASIIRSSLSIAKQIKRYLLPRYTEVLNDLIGKIKREDEHKKNMSHALRVVSKGTGLRIVNRLNSNYRYIDFYTANSDSAQEIAVDGEHTIQIKLRNLTPLEAIKVVHAIKKNSSEGA